MSINVQKAEFIKSAADKKAFLRDSRPTAVFAGRSNVGKSSVINRLLNRNNFARVGGKPGKTVQVNYFLVDKCYFVDLPGYGFAKVSGEERERWGRLMEDFFAEPERISLGVMLVDARHRPSADDVTMSDYFWSCGSPFCVVANKADKLKKSEIPERLAEISETLHLPEGFPLILFSAETGQGRGELLSLLEKSL
ncbi:MAG: ribosome biogenesis GTP-binding protein YihA/YsxC [Oscillospiraceae bacterium]|nr:ribosome biogenesis GTP-binding protein YihA/YsxC [Oscillospiraceae bacterium]